MKIWLLLSCLNNISTKNVNTCDLCYFILSAASFSSLCNVCFAWERVMPIHPFISAAQRVALSSGVHESQGEKKIFICISLKGRKQEDQKRPRKYVIGLLSFSEGCVIESENQNVGLKAPLRTRSK